ncbi:hypothetical protein FB451DRAFT_75597 [Mycena latifolia]|nr:hypothetical protein FB451DRAFT_75597 [Mycena latifolia]
MSNDSAFTPVNDLWFSSDTLILRAEDKGFRVSKSVLAARSPVFQSMLEFPQPVSDGDEIMDGSPVVRLHDSAEDVEAFLRAIFDSSYFMPPPAEIDFNAVLGILRLSHKYDVDYLHRRALRHLETVYPTELALALPASNIQYGNGGIALHLRALRIIQELGATWLLPCAFYMVGTYLPGTLIGAGETWDSLPIDMKQTCLTLQSDLIRAVARINGFFTTLSTCVEAEACNVGKLKYLSMRLTHRDPGGEDPFSEWEEDDWDYMAKFICAECISRARAEHKILEAHIWGELPAYCGLESWDVLQEKRRAALS